MGKQRGFPDSGKGAQDEPSQAEDTASGELLREGNSLEGNQKEQCGEGGFRTAVAVTARAPA